MEWHDVKTKMPPDTNEVLVSDGDGAYAVAWVSSGGEWQAAYDILSADNYDGMCAIEIDSDDINFWTEISWEFKTKARQAATPEPMSKPGVDDVLPAVIKDLQSMNETARKNFVSVFNCNLGDIHDEVIKDLQGRDALGREKYGTTLQTHNGRDALNDLMQEQYDGIMYLKQAIMERDDSFESKIADWANERGLYDVATPYSQMKKLFEEILEWHAEVVAGDVEKEKMELGDCLVVLTNIANLRGYSLNKCGWLAYNKIKNRTGHMENGSFVKDGNQ